MHWNRCRSKRVTAAMEEKKAPEHHETLRFLRRRDLARQKALDRRFRDAWRDFDRIVSRIAADYHPRRIWQWGSLLDRRRFSEVSDLDIAVEGLASAAELFAIVAQAEEISDFPIDIIELERTPPEYRALIKRTGRLVYGSP